MSSTQTGLTVKPAKIAELFSKCKEIAAQEEREMAKIQGVILPLLAYVEEPILLHPAQLGPSFQGARSVALKAGARIVTTDVHGLTSTVPLAAFEANECLAILRDVLPELKRLVAEKERATRIKPAIAMKLVLAGQRRILDTRSYHIVILNSGGDCRSLTVGVGLGDGSVEPRKEHDLDRGMRMELDLGVFKEVEGLESLNLKVECKDVDGREFVGVGSLPVDGTWFEQALMKKSWIASGRKT